MLGVYVPLAPTASLVSIGEMRDEASKFRMEGGPVLSKERAQERFLVVLPCSSGLGTLANLLSQTFGESTENAIGLAMESVAASEEQFVAYWDARRQKTQSGFTHKGKHVHLRTGKTLDLDQTVVMPSDLFGR